MQQMSREREREREREGIKLDTTGWEGDPVEIVQEV